MLKILVLTTEQLQKWPPTLLRSVTPLANDKSAVVVLANVIGQKPFESAIQYRISSAATVSEAVLEQLKEADLLPAPAKPKAAAKPKRKAATKKKTAPKKKDSK